MSSVESEILSGWTAYEYVQASRDILTIQDRPAATLAEINDLVFPAGQARRLASTIHLGPQMVVAQHSDGKTEEQRRIEIGKNEYVVPL